MRLPTHHLRPRITCGASVLVLLAVLAAVVAGRPSQGPALFGQHVGGVPTTTEPEMLALPGPTPPVVTPEPVPLPPTTPPPVPPPPASTNLVGFTTQAEFLARVQREALRQVTATGLPGYGMLGGGFGRVGDPAVSPGMPRPSVAPAASPVAGSPAAGSGSSSTPALATSGTNVQEAGVDEPDIVKTDGRVLVALRSRSLEVVDVGGAPRPMSSVPLAEGQPTSVLLVGTRAMVFSALPSSTSQPLAQTDVVVVELADPARPKVVRSHRLAGSLVSARLLAGTARVVLAHPPQIPWSVPVDGSRRGQDAALERNRQKIRASTFEQWVAPGTGCRDAYTSLVESGLATVAVRTVDPAAAEPGPGVCVTSQASTVYASTGALYVGTTTFEVAQALAAGRPAAEPKTSLHRFDLTDPAQARYTGSGEVNGTLLNQFSLSEHNGDLRVATTRSGLANGSESQVAVLRPSGPSLTPIGLLGGLGRTERIFAVRFVGDIGYVVTFSQQLCDPLFAIDLSDPTRPTLRGTLEVQGFSSYLHPTGPGRVLSIGRDAPGSRSPGALCGTTSPQLSLYDVSRPDQPRQLQRLVLPSGFSEAERDHHAFTWWAPSRLLVIPIGLAETRFSGALALRVEDGGITEVARITHPTSTTGSQIKRSFVVGGRLLTVSANGVASNDLASLADQGFTAFSG
jgi:uncharacterized secreted protein with C-terminal beta-propeller domain